MLRAVIVLMTLTLSSVVWAQERCGTEAPTSGNFERWIAQKITNKLSRTREPRLEPPVYQIPIVVHVLHQGESLGSGSNLPKARILAQIDSLNADFRRLNADTLNTPTEFLGVAADSEIEFFLAQQDPDGNPTDGIVRVNASERFNPVSTSDLIKMRSLSYWPAEDYMNIYVNRLTPGFIGLAIFPETDLAGIDLNSDRLFLDAVFVDDDYFGNNPEAPAFESRGRTLTHEVGHFLGLRHIWGDPKGVPGCSVDDFVDDTPLSDRSNSGLTSPCSFPNPEDEIVCVPGEPEMFQNFMDYTDDICMNLFTEGQKTRMRTVLENSPRRNSLLTSQGLVAPARFENDLAITAILSPGPAECSDQFTPTVEVTNWGTDTISSYQINLVVNGSHISTRQKIETLPPFKKDTLFFTNEFIGPTPQTVSFEIAEVDGAQDGDGSNNLLSKSIDYNIPFSLPFIEDFEAGTNMTGLIGSSSIWEVTTAPNTSSSNQALTFKAFENTTVNKEETILITPSLDLSGFENVDLIFSYAYANDPSAYHDGLQVLISYDCGAHFEQDPVFQTMGPSLSTRSNLSVETAYIPQEDEWVTTNILLQKPEGEDSYGSEVQLAFIGLSGGGNNIYLDDITIDDTNRRENDASITNLFAPQVTCNDSSNIELSVRNVGTTTINSFKIDYTVNAQVFSNAFDGLSIPPDHFGHVEFKVGNPLPTNELVIEIKEVNATVDDSTSLNVIRSTIQINDAQDEYPLLLNFESSDSWVTSSPSDNNLWVRDFDGQNSFLRASGFEEETLGVESWFVSPELNTGGLDSAGLFFRASYAKRESFNDELFVLVSYNCGESYRDTILYANADSLALTETTERWVPLTESDWKDFSIDLKKTIPAESDLRIAFLFINGNGNDLYIDDLSIRANTPPSFEDLFLVYPNNPSAGTLFNLSLNFTQKRALTIELISTTGEIIESAQVSNALNQIVTFNAPFQTGLYFIRVTGSNFTQTQKLLVSP